MRAAIDMSEWFGHEAERVYAMLAEQPEDRETRHLVELIQRKGGKIKPRDLQRINDRRYPTAAHAEAALEALVSAGVGDWDLPVNNQKGGRPSRVFSLDPNYGNVDRQNPTDSEETDGEEGIGLSDTTESPRQTMAETTGETEVVSGSVGGAYPLKVIETSVHEAKSVERSVEDLSGETVQQKRRKTRIKPSPNGGLEGTA